MLPERVIREVRECALLYKDIPSAPGAEYDFNKKRRRFLIDHLANMLHLANGLDVQLLDGRVVSLREYARASGNPL